MIRRTITIILAALIFFAPLAYTLTHLPASKPEPELVLPKETWEVGSCWRTQYMLHKAGDKTMGEKIICINKHLKPMAEGISDKEPLVK